MELAEPGRCIGRNITRGEQVESDLDNFISKRHNERVASEGERAVEQSWKASVRRFNALQKAEEDSQRLAWFKHLRGVYVARAQEYERRIEIMEDAS